MTNKEVFLKLKDIKSELDTVNTDQGIDSLSDKGLHSLENAENMLIKLAVEFDDSCPHKKLENFVNGYSKPEAKYGRGTLALTKSYVDAPKTDERPWRTYSVEILRGNGDTVWVPVSGQDQAMTIQYALHYYKHNTGDNKAKIIDVKETKED